MIVQRAKEPLRYVKNDDDEAFKIFQDNETNWQVSYTFTVQYLFYISLNFDTLVNDKISYNLKIAD